MFAFSRTWVEEDLFPMLSPSVYTDLQEKKNEGLPPDFLWSLVALANLMRLSLLKAAYVDVGECHVAGIRVAHLLQPMYAKVREHGAPVQGARLGGKARDLLRNQRHLRLRRQAGCSLGTNWRDLQFLLQFSRKRCNSVSDGQLSLAGPA